MTTRFADDETLAHIAKLERELAECQRERDELKSFWFADADPEETKYAEEYALAKVGAEKGENNEQ